MAVTINGSDTAAGDTGGLGFTSAEGLILTGQGSSNDVTIKNDADGTVAVIPTGTTNFGFDSGFGSAGVAYGVRAWINFTGSGTVAILESGNVSSLTDNGTGNYTVTFANNMTDKNYAVNAQQCAGADSNGAGFVEIFGFNNQTVSLVKIQVRTASGNFDPLNAQLAVIR